MWEAFDANVEDIDRYRVHGHTWVAIAHMTQTTTKTLRKWRKRVGYIDPREEMEPEDMDAIVADFIEG